MRLRYLPVILLAAAALALAFGGFGPGPDRAAATQEAPQVAETAPAPEPPGPGMSIPCFRCHGRERYDDPAVFPHELHKSMELHCNQCHVLKAHESISLNGETCKGCHNLGVMEMARTSMSATFNHENHAAMFACANCHQDLFKMKSGSTKVTMSDIYEGRYCGRCHNGEIASAPDNCASCHKG